MLRTKMAMFFLLFVLVCCVSSTPLQTESDNNIIPHLQQTQSQRQQPANSSENQQTCTSDIHAVLREMSALLGGLKVEMTYLQRENEALAAKVRELELQKTELDKLKEQYQALAAKVRELELQKTELDELKEQYQGQEGELINLKARTNITENNVEALKRAGEVKQVAFSASLLASGSGTTGPFNALTTLVFRHVVTNIGNAYNPHSGFFIAPVRGAYHFEFYIGAHGHNSYPSAAVLVRNGEHVFIAYEHQPSHYGTSSNGATLLLEAGDVVFLRLWTNTRIFDSESHHSTFSGHLLFAM